METNGHVKLEDDEFKLLSDALRVMHRQGRDAERILKRAEAQAAQARADALDAVHDMRTVLDPLADKYGFDPDSQYALDYASRSLIPKR